MTEPKLLEQQMIFASAMTTEPDVDQAIQALLDQVKTQMEGRAVDFMLIFLSPHFRLAAGAIAKALRVALDPAVLIGCTGEGVIGREAEIEHEPAISLVVAQLPGVELKPFVLQSMDWEMILADPVRFRQMVGAPEAVKLFVMVADPFTTPMEAVLAAFNTYYPALPIIGGMASGSQRAGGNALLLNERVLNHGAVGVAMAGAFELDLIVSQGCRPVGRPFKVTAAQENIILSLEEQPPLLHLQDMVRELSTTDRALLQQGLYVGRAIDSGQKTLGRGDFLIRGLIGIDQQSGALVIGDYVNAGEMIQFHLRDAATAEEDLEMMLAPQLFFEPPSGGFLFSCNGRGTRLYDHPHGDITTIQKVIGHIDLAGFFCAGEIGPIGNKNFLHGHTASLVLFRPQAVDILSDVSSQ